MKAGRNPPRLMSLQSDAPDSLRRALWLAAGDRADASWPISARRLSRLWRPPPAPSPPAHGSSVCSPGVWRSSAHGIVVGLGITSAAWLTTHSGAPAKSVGYDTPVPVVVEQVAAIESSALPAPPFPAQTHASVAAARADDRGFDPGDAAYCRPLARASFASASARVAAFGRSGGPSGRPSGGRAVGFRTAARFPRGSRRAFAARARPRSARDSTRLGPRFGARSRSALPARPAGPGARRADHPGAPAARARGTGRAGREDLPRTLSQFSVRPSGRTFDRPMTVSMHAAPALA